jgi:D-apionolactonase
VPSLSMLRRGSDIAPTAAIDLKAGPLSMVFEPDQVFLRYIRLGKHEILRGVYAAVRDHNWDTVPPKISQLELEEKEGGFVLGFAVECCAGGVDFGWQGRIEGTATGCLRFGLKGTARSAFSRNRIGFCVLHPLDCADKKVRITHTDGDEEEGVFPQQIAPDQPFMDMAAIAHQVGDGLWAQVRFAGDVFEMEDQRNWTDASYKTYCTPLALPYPVELHQGDRVEQAVELSFSGELPTALSGAAPVVRLGLPDTPEAPCAEMPLPPIGLGMASHGRPLVQDEIIRLRALNLAHLRVDLHLAADDWASALHRAVAEAKALDVRLQVAVFVDDEAVEELRALVVVLEEVRPPLQAFLIFHEKEKSTGRRWIEAAREILGAYDSEVALGAGTNAYFTELNRQRPPAEALDLICYSINPQVHAFDDASLVETLEAQALTVASARCFAAGRPVHVGPITLRPRFNPNATGPEASPEPGCLPAPVDARQLSLLGAGWTLGSIKYLAQSGAASLTYFETTGWRGVMENQGGSLLPSSFPAEAGAVFPLYHVLAAVGEFCGGLILPLDSGDPLRAEALLLRQGTRRCILAANLGPDLQRIEVEVPGGAATIRLLDENSAAGFDAQTFRSGPDQKISPVGGLYALELPPYAVARIDWEE